MKKTVKSRGPGYDVMRALYRNKLAMACLIIILLLLLISCTCGPARHILPSEL